jgi:hypothetical protein
MESPRSPRAKKSKLAPPVAQEPEGPCSIMVEGYVVEITPQHFSLPHQLIFNEFRNVAGPALHKVLSCFMFLFCLFLLIEWGGGLR